jgi:hypothetical protein
VSGVTIGSHQFLCAHHGETRTFAFCRVTLVNLREKFRINRVGKGPIMSYLIRGLWPLHFPVLPSLCHQHRSLHSCSRLRVYSEGESRRENADGFCVILLCFKFQGTPNEFDHSKSQCQSLQGEASLLDFVLCLRAWQVLSCRPGLVREARLPDFTTLNSLSIIYIVLLGSKLWVFSDHGRRGHPAT